MEKMGATAAELERLVGESSRSSSAERTSTPQATSEGASAPSTPPSTAAESPVVVGAAQAGPQMNFLITRHARSCNNEVTRNKMGKVKAALGKTDMEPGLTDIGIYRTAIHGLINSSTYSSRRVFVSCLYRTWCTAI